jgi:hypothetical protein
MNWPKLNSLFVICLLFVSITSCKKESVTTSTADVSPPPPTSENAQTNSPNECRLTLMEWAYGSYGFQYNAQGLCTQMQVSDVGTFQQQYNASGKLIQSKYYSDGFLQSTIVFTYNNAGVITKETRYLENTTQKTDEIFITRNNQGYITRFESFMNNYHINAQYSPQGNNTSWQLYVSNQLAYDAVLEYRQSIKNQFKSVKGIDYGFPFINGFMFQSKFTPASEKLTIYDEFGNAYLLYDYDPDISLTVAGFQNYPGFSDRFERVSQGWMMYNFFYDNGSTSSARTSSSSVNSQGFTRNNALQNLFVITPGLDAKQSIITKRDALLKKINKR